MLVVPQDGALFLQELWRTGGDLDPQAALFINNLVPTVNTTLSDLIEASFDGYARANMGTPHAPEHGPGGSAILKWDPVLWSTGTGLPAQTAFGYFVVQLDGLSHLRLLWLEKMTPSVDFSHPSQSLVANLLLVTKSLFG